MNDPTADRPAPEQRLHPWSWLFVLLARLRPFVLPAALLLFFGRGESWELWGAAGAVAIALWSLVYSLAFRYRLAPGELIVREGVVFRTVRHVPITRVQSIVQRRNALHRLFGVTELRLESSGGSRPEAVMNVITVDAAEHLERQLRAAAAAEPPASAAAPAAATLFVLRPGDLLRLGLVSDRGWVPIGIAIGLWWQFAPDDQRLVRHVERWFFALVKLWQGNPNAALGGLGLSVAGLIVFALLLKPLSVAMTALLFHGFHLQRDGSRLASAAGLVTRRSASARAERLQRLVWSAPALARLMGRRQLHCDVAVPPQEQNAGEMARLRWLVPMGTPAAVDGVVDAVAPALGLDRRTWRPLHPRAWLRVWKHWLVAAAIAAIAFAWLLSYWTVVPALAIAAWGWFSARGWARFAAWAHDGGALAFRAGFLHRQWTTALVRDGHVVVRSQSPFDRRAGMASVALDTAGASPALFRLHVPYLPVDEATALHAALVGGTAPTAADRARP